MDIYFATYLPVEGEIKQNDFYKHPDYPGILFKFQEPWDYKKDKSFKVELSLCNRNIKVGDKAFLKDKLELGEREVKIFHNAQFEETVGWSEVGVNRNSLFKKIGKISPNATWVKEGDKFEEKELAIIVNKDYLSLRDFLNDAVEDKKKFPDYNPFPLREKIAVIGPCGHFH